MSGYQGHGTRPRVNCPSCGRSIAVTINKQTGQLYVRTHVVKPGEKCPMSTRAMPPGAPVHHRPWK